MTSPVVSSRRLDLSPESFYWAVIDASVIDRASPSRRQLGYLFEHVLPLPVDDVQAVYQRLPGPGRRYVACGMDRQTLRQKIDESGDTLIALGPAELPALVRSADPDGRVQPGDFNLLTEEFEAPSVRRMRRRWLAAMLLLVGIAGALITIGFWRRTEALEDHTIALRRQQFDLYQQVFSTTQLAELRPGLTPERLLTAEVRQLRRTRSDLPGDLRTADASGALAALLGAWPGDLAARAESIVVSDVIIEVRAVLPVSDDVQRLSDALSRLEGWDLQPLQTRALDGGVRAVLRFEPSTSADRRAKLQAPSLGGPFSGWRLAPVKLVPQCPASPVTMQSARRVRSFRGSSHHPLSAPLRPGSWTFEVGRWMFEVGRWMLLVHMPLTVQRAQRAPADVPNGGGTPPASPSKVKSALVLVPTAHCLRIP